MMRPRTDDVKPRSRIFLRPRSRPITMRPKPDAYWTFIRRLLVTIPYKNLENI